MCVCVVQLMRKLHAAKVDRLHSENLFANQLLPSELVTSGEEKCKLQYLCNAVLPENEFALKPQVPTGKKRENVVTPGSLFYQRKVILTAFTKVRTSPT